jgi:hypothetical protein
VTVNRLSTTLAIALTASCAAFATGCAGSSSSQTSSASVSPIRGLSPHAQYAAFAQVVNLRSDDLPGFVEEAKQRFHVGNRALEGEAVYRHCSGGVTPSKPVFKAGSHKYQSGRGLSVETVSSSVEVVRSARAADRAMATVRKLLESAGPRECLSRLFDQLGSEAQTKRVGRAALRITVGNLTLAPIRLSKPPSGSSAAAGLTMTMNVTYHVSVAERRVTVPVTLRLDVLGMAVGRAEISLVTLVLGAPFPASTEARLFALLASRASTASHLYAAVNG